MITLKASADLELQASEALQALLAQVSGLRIKEIKHQPKSRDRAFDILARIEVFGHPHTLACKVKAPASDRLLQAALDDLCARTAQLSSTAIPVMIAPCLSYEAQEICKHARAGFIDLEGNARLDLGEIFIGVRSHPCRASDRPTVPAVPASSHVIDPASFRHVPRHSSRVALIA